MKWNPKDLERFVRATSCTLTAREWEVVQRNMKGFYASDGALPADPRCHSWFGEAPAEKSWDDFVAVTAREREAAVPTTAVVDADAKRREYHRVYQQRRRWLAKNMKEGATTSLEGMPGRE